MDGDIYLARSGPLLHLLQMRMRSIRDSVFPAIYESEEKKDSWMLQAGHGDKISYKSNYHSEQIYQKMRCQCRKQIYNFLAFDINLCRLIEWVYIMLSRYFS